MCACVMDVNLDIEFDKFAFRNVCGKRCQYIDHIFQFTCLCFCNGILYLIDIYYNTFLRFYLSLLLLRPFSMHSEWLSRSFVQSLKNLPLKSTFIRFGKAWGTKIVSKQKWINDFNVSFSIWNRTWNSNKTRTIHLYTGCMWEYFLYSQLVKTYHFSIILKMTIKPLLKAKKR